MRAVASLPWQLATDSPLTVYSLSVQDLPDPRESPDVREIPDRRDSLAFRDRVVSRDILVSVVSRATQEQLVRRVRWTKS